MASTDNPLSRRDAFRTIGGAALAIAAPGLRARADEKRLPGRICVYTLERAGAAPHAAIAGVLLLDPNDGTWSQVAPSHFMWPRISPDGRRILCYRMASPPDYGVYLCESEGGEPPRKLSDSSTHFFCWSADGKEVFFSERTNLDFRSWRMKPDGTGKVALPIAETDSILDASPDGRWLVTASWRGVKEKSLQVMDTRAIHLVRPDGTGDRRLLDPGPFRTSVRFSPDSRTLVFERHDTYRRGPWRLEMIDVEGGKPRTFLGPRESDGPVLAAWSPDGKELAVLYRSDDGQPLDAASFEKLAYHLEIVSADGKNARRLDVLDGILFALGDWR